MKIGQKEYNFIYTVRASVAIAKGLPNHKISEIVEIMKTEDQIEIVELISLMAIEMNRAYLYKKAEEDGTSFDESDLITSDMILDLTSAQEQQLENELMTAMMEGQNTEIVAEAKKKAKKAMSNSTRRG